jgi:hypothetical protein
MIALPEPPADLAGWAQLDDATFEALLRNALEPES